MREANLVFILENIHPGVAFRYGMHGFDGKGSRAGQYAFNYSQANGKKDGKAQGKNAAGDPEYFGFGDAHI